MQTISVSKTENLHVTDKSNVTLLWLMSAIALATCIAIILPQNEQQVVVVLLTLGLSLFCLRSERLALPVALAYLPLGVRLNLGGENLSLLISFWLFDLICLKNFFWIVRQKNWKRFFSIKPSVGLFLTLFGAAIVVSTIFSINQGLSARKLYDLGQYLAVFLAITSTSTRYSTISFDLLLEALLLSSGVTALLGTLEFYSQFAWPTPYLARDFYLQHTASLFEGTRSFALLSDGLDNWVLINGPLRAFGSLLTPAGLGQYLLLGVVILVIYVPLRQFYALSKTKLRPNLNWIFLWIVSEFIFLAIFFTYARASWFVAIAIALTGGIVWLRNRKKLKWPQPRKLILGFVICIVPLGMNLLVFSLYHYTFTGEIKAATGVPTTCDRSPCWAVISSTNKKQTSFIQSGFISDLIQPFEAPITFQAAQTVTNTTQPAPTETPVPLEVNPNFAQNQQQPLVRLLQIFNLQDHSTQDRFDAWKYGFRAFPAHPIFGRGPGTFGLGGLAQKNMYALPEEITPAIEQASIQAHNMYLNFLVEDGSIGLGLYLLLISYTLYKLLLLRPQTLALLATKLILIIWLVAFSWDEFFDNLFLYTKNGALLFVALGMASILINRVSKTSRPAKF